MAHMVLEWLDRRLVSFPVGNIVGETAVIGDVLDVGDWEEFFVEVATIGTAGSPGASDLQFRVETAISANKFSQWDNINASAGNSNCSTSADGTVTLRCTGSSTNPPRKFIRLVFVHNATTPNQTITVHVWVLLKKRTP